MSSLPALPAGFQLEDGQAALPQLPAGFVPEKQPNSFMDTLRGIPRSMLSGLVDTATLGAQAEANAMSQPDLAEQIPNTDEALKAIEPITGHLYEPQTAMGKIVGSGIRSLATPASFMGPGSLALKAGGAMLSGMGGEAGRELAQGTPYEGAAQLAGSLAGGITGAKTLGPTAEKSAVPTLRDLKIAADKGYNAARNSGVEFSPVKVANEFAAPATQELTSGKYGFTGGPDGTAPKTLALLDKLQNPPQGAAITAANLDTLRKNINTITGETRDFKPTPDAKAAMVLKQRLADYLENPPPGHIVAGNPQDYVSAVKEANGNYAAASRLQNFDARIEKAGNQTNRQIAGSLDARIKANIGSVLDKPKSLRGLTPEEVSQIRLINDGTLTSNTLRQLGRGGAGVIPIGAHVGAAVTTHGASIPASLGIGIPLYAARKISERMTVSRANDLADMLAKRSPLYQQSSSKIPLPPQSPYAAAIMRSLIGIH